MSETKLKPGNFTDAEITPAQCDSSELQTMENPAPVKHVSATPGEFNSLSEFSIPPSYLRIAYGVGALSDKNFPNGALVLDSTTKIANMKEPITFVAFGASEFYKTWMGKEQYALKQQAGQYPTRQAAIDAGETVEWIGGKGPSAAPALSLLMLVQRPPDCDAEQFILKLGDAFYAPVSCTFDKGLYRDVSTFFKRVAFLDAGLRGVPLQEGRLDKWFLTLHTYSTEMPNGNRVTHACVNFLQKDGKRVEVPPQVMEDMHAIGLKVRSATRPGDSAVVAEDL